MPSSLFCMKLECFLIFAAFPPAFAALRPHSWMYVALWIAFLLCGRTLAKGGYSLRTDWNWSIVTRQELARLFMRFLPLAFALICFTYLTIPERLFNFPRERPQLWAMVMLLYPLLSVVPQELIFRSFFFRRYAPLFGEGRMMTVASALAFGWVHVLLLNWVAVVFSIVGGWLFADTYRKTKSLAATSLEHALYGNLIFTLGLGYYFYHGQAVR